MRFVGDIALDAEVRAIASGAITDGEPVIVNSTGTVSGVTDATAQALGSEVVFESAASKYSATTFDSNSNRIVVAYQDEGNSNYGTAIVGTISGTSISYGTAVVFESAQANWVNATFDSSNNKVVITYQDAGNSNYGTAIVGTVDSSDNSISYGSPTVFNSATTNQGKITFDSSNNKVVVAYNNGGDSGHGYAIVGTVSGTSISFGSAAEFENAVISDPAITFDTDTNQVIIAYRDEGNSNYGTAIVGTVSGTSISFGSPSVYHTVNASETAVTYDSNAQRIVVAYTNGGDNDHGYAVVGIVGTTEFDGFGTPVEFRNADQRYNAIAFDSSVNKVVISFREDDDSNKGKLVVGTVSGTGISFGDPVEFNGGTTSFTNSTFDSFNNKVIITYKDGGNSGYGTSIIFANAAPTTLTSENFIGFAHAAYADGQKATVKTTGSIARNIPQVPSASSSLGTAVSFESATTSRIASCFDSTNNRIVVSYVDSGSDDDGTVAVGTVSASDNSISWGTPVHFNSNVKITDSQIIHDSNSNKIVVAYTDEDNSFYGTGIVGTIDTSDNSISFGSPTVYESGNTNTSSRNGITFDSNSNKVVICYVDQGNSYYGTAVVGTVSGTSISFGTPVVFESAFSIHMGATFDTSNNKVVIAYRDVGNSEYGTAIVGTVSGTSISFGTAVVYESAESDWNSITFDSNSNKVVISYQDKGNSGYGTAIVGTVSGTSISFGTAVVYESASVNYTAIDFDSNLNKVIIGYEDIGNSEYGTFVIGTVSGTSISFTSPAVFYSGELSWVGVSFDSNAKRSVFTYRDADNSNNGRSVVMQPAGISVDLTIGQQYFVQTDGTLDTSADDPSVIAGTAIGASDIVVKG